MNTKLNKIFAEISAGELIDKITILEIKKEKILNKEKLLEINKELNSLLDTLNKSNIDKVSIEVLWAELKKINLTLWDIEDGKRDAEKKKEFGDDFIKLARKVYKINDQRADIKLKINMSLGSNIKEVKSYY
mgnify:FL=1